VKKVTVNSYRKDKYYSSVVRAAGIILDQGDVFTPIDILIEMGSLSKNNYEAWRKGHVPYLEQVIEGSLSKANRILRIIGFHAHDLNMVSRGSVYQQWGKGGKQVLRFSKSGDLNIEKAYSRQYIWNRSQENKLEVINEYRPE
jgi:hypothetical protein